MDKQSNIKYLPIIDISRLFCALLVVLIHFNFQLSNNQVFTFIIKCFSAQAVPFFMIISGFFWAKKISIKNNDESIMNNTKNICINYLMLYLVWTILWLPWLVNMYKSIYTDTSLTYFILLLIRRILIAGQGVYWYLLILAESLFIAAILVKYNKERLLYFIGIVGLILGILYDANFNMFGMQYINKLFYVIFSWSNNLIMKGLPYVAIGYYFNKNINKVKNNTKIAILLYVISSALMIIFFKNGNYQWLSFYPLQAISLFVISNKPLNISNPILFKNCRNVSSCIYYLHTAFEYGLATTLFANVTNSVIQVLITILLCTGVCCIVKKLNIKPVMWLLSIK